MDKDPKDFITLAAGEEMNYSTELLNITANIFHLLAA
jgi:hypothetical protein